MSLTIVKSAQSAAPDGDTRSVIKTLAARELFFAVVGPVGAGSSHVARQLSRCLSSATLNGTPFTCATIKASDAIRESYDSEDQFNKVMPGLNPLERKIAMQERGDTLRERDHAAIAANVIRRIAESRAQMQKVDFQRGVPVEPDGKPRTYIIDSLKHPAEVKLLRRLYGDAFVLIGVVCSPPVLKDRLGNALFNGNERSLPKNIAALESFIRRDGDDPEKKHGICSSPPGVVAGCWSGRLRGAG